MPEGHVSHRNARDLTAALAGRPLVRVWTIEPRVLPQRIPERLQGDAVAGAEARGKHHLLRFASGRVLHSHLMMSGAWRVRSGARPVSPRGLFLGLAVDGATACLYRCPTVRLLEPGEPLPAAVLRLGADLLAPDVDPAAATAAALARCEPARQVGDALLDQRLVSGIGNVYKNETLFLAGVDPWRAVGSLDAAQAAALGRIAADLLAGGVHTRGPISTYDPPGRPPGARAQGETWVHGRVGRPCRRCGTPIRSRGQGDANRTTYWCPACQA